MLRPGPHREGEEPKPMMHERGKSDSAVRAVKPANKAERSAAELVEQRAGTKGNADQQSTRRAQERESVSQALGRIRQAAKQRKKETFTTLFHHISVELLRLSFFEIKKDATPGVDGLTWQDYEADLDRNIEGLHDRVHRGAYRAQPSRRLYIPKPDGRQRPIAIAALEDKIVQRATAAVLNTIYEEDFRSESGTAEPSTVHTKARRPTASNRDCRPRRQDRPEGDCRGAEYDLRGGLPRLFVWVPPQAQPARCAGRLGGRDHQHKGELDTRGRRPKLFR